MARNLELYPDDFGSAQLGTSAVSYTIQDAVSSIELQARDTAIRNVYARRSAGQAAIETQLQVISFKNYLMPLNKVGTVLKAPLLGTAAYLGGGRALPGSVTVSAYVYELRFSNEVLTCLDVRLSLPRLYCGTVANAESGKFVGGIDVNANLYTDVCEKYTYSKSQMQRISSLLANPIAGAAGGMGDAVRGVVAGGATFYNVATRTGHAYAHATDTISTLSNFLPAAKYSPHNGVSSKTSGFVWSGATPATTADIVDTIDRIDYAAGTLTATAIGTSTTHAHIVHAAYNSDIKGYIAGGSTATAWASADASQFFDDKIHALTYSGQTVALLAARLKERLICADGANSSEGGYIVGGDTPTSAWAGSTTIQKMLYSSEALSTIGATLTRKTSDQGSFSDYGPAYSK